MEPAVKIAPLTDSTKDSKPTSGFTDEAKSSFFSHGIVLLIFGLIILGFAIACIVSTYSLTHKKTQAFVCVHAVLLILASLAAIRVKFVKKDEGMERFVGCIGLTIHKISKMSGIVAIFHAFLSLLLEGGAIVFGYLDHNHLVYNYTALLPITNAALSLIETVLLCVQVGIGARFHPKKKKKLASIDDSLLQRADALGCFLSFEPVIVSLFCFSPNDLNRSGPWTNFFTAMIGSTSSFQVCKLFFVLALVFGLLMQVTIVAIVVFGSLLKFHNKGLMYGLAATFIILSFMVFLVLLAAFIVQIVFIIGSVVNQGGYLRALFLSISGSDSAGSATSILETLFQTVIDLILPVVVNIVILILLLVGFNIMPIFTVKNYVRSFFNKEAVTAQDEEEKKRKEVEMEKPGIAPPQQMV